MPPCSATGGPLCECRHTKERRFNASGVTISPRLLPLYGPTREVVVNTSDARPIRERRPVVNGLAPALRAHLIQPTRTNM